MSRRSGPAQRAALDLFVFGSCRAREGSMTDLPDFVALSLLPCAYFGRIAERLRQGERAGAIIRSLVETHWRDEPDKLATLQSRADAGIRRARDRDIAPL